MRHLIGLALLLPFSVMAQNTPSKYDLKPYYNGVVFANQVWKDTIQTYQWKQYEITRREHLVSGDGYFVSDHLEQECSGRLRCYGEILSIYGNVNAPGGISADSVRVKNTGTGYAIARKTAVRGNDLYGSAGHQINLNRTHSGIVIGGDEANDGTDRTYLGIWINESLLVTDSAIRWNTKNQQGEGWFIKMLLPDGRQYGMDNKGVLYVKEIKYIP